MRGFPNIQFMAWGICIKQQFSKRKTIWQAAYLTLPSARHTGVHQYTDWCFSAPNFYRLVGYIHTGWQDSTGVVIFLSKFICIVWRSAMQHNHHAPSLLETGEFFSDVFSQKQIFFQMSLSLFPKYCLAQIAMQDIINNKNVLLCKITIRLLSKYDPDLQYEMNGIWNM